MRAALLSLGVCLAPGLARELTAQEATVHVAFASRPDRSGAPAIEWLCSQHLPRRPEWPRDLDPARPFALQLSATGLRITAETPPLPIGVAASGSCAVNGGPAWLWSCDSGGVEDWFVPAGAEVPAAWLRLLRDLGADALAEPRSLDVGVVIGHLAGVTVDGDPRGELLRLGGAACGEVTWTAWTTPSHVRVRGRGDGGLMLPATLVLLAAQGNPQAVGSLPLRAFAARDGDRAEAARQMSRRDDEASENALQALLHADDKTALAAIDALVLRHDAERLPQIVAAARPEASWTSLAAADAIKALWQQASPTARQETRAALRRSRDLDLRRVDLDALPTLAAAERPEPEPPEPDTARVRALVLLALLAVGVYGLWSRQRAMLREPAF
jgi:hypothetical protein